MTDIRTLKLMNYPKLYASNINGLVVISEILIYHVWKLIAGKNDIEFKKISYVSDKPRLLEDSKRFFKMMEEHLSLMY